MPYVLRNKNGKIKSFHQGEPPLDAEAMGPDNYNEIVKYLVDKQLLGDLQQVLVSSDLEMIRVLEDVVDLLCKNHIITFTDLPEAAQKKMTQRKNVRAGIDGIENLVSDEDDAIF